MLTVTKGDDTIYQQIVKVSGNIFFKLSNVKGYQKLFTLVERYCQQSRVVQYGVFYKPVWPTNPARFANDRILAGQLEALEANARRAPVEMMDDEPSTDDTTSEHDENFDLDEINEFIVQGEGSSVYTEESSVFPESERESVGCFDIHDALNEITDALEKCAEDVCHGVRDFFSC